MKITYTNPAPDEDMHPGEAVHWKDRGQRYFSYKDLWFEQLDRRFVLGGLKQIDRSKNLEASDAIAFQVGADECDPRIRSVGFITNELPLAVEMVHRAVDFVFDETTGLFFFDLRGRHESLMSNLHHLHTGVDLYDTPRAADAYVEQGLGMFRSSQAARLHLGANATLPTWAKASKITLCRMDAP